MRHSRTHNLGVCIALALSAFSFSASAQHAPSLAEAPLTLAASIDELAAQPAQQLPPCQSPPDDASKDMVVCMGNACKAYRDAWANCDSDECRTLAAFQYALALGQCGPAQQGWATIWYFNGTYGVAFEPSAVPEGVVRFDF